MRAPERSHVSGMSRCRIDLGLAWRAPAPLQTKSFEGRGQLSTGAPPVWIRDPMPGRGTLFRPSVYTPAFLATVIDVHLSESIYICTVTLLLVVKIVKPGLGTHGTH